MSIITFLGQALSLDSLVEEEELDQYDLIKEGQHEIQDYIFFFESEHDTALNKPWSWITEQRHYCQPRIS